MQQIYIGLMTEGKTDWRFFESIVIETFKEISFECNQVPEVYSVRFVKDLEEKKFIDKVLEASKKGVEEFGITILCVQADADTTTSKDTYQYKINPAKKILKEQNEEDYCKILVALVPLQETESWLLADKELFKNEIGTTKTNKQLGINRNPEAIANPKEIIQEAIRIVQKKNTKQRRDEINISELYKKIGDNLDLRKLDQLESYQDFKNNVREAYKELGLLY